MHDLNCYKNQEVFFYGGLDFVNYFLENKTKINVYKEKYVGYVYVFLLLRPGECSYEEKSIVFCISGLSTHYMLCRCDLITLMIIDCQLCLGMPFSTTKVGKISENGNFCPDKMQIYLKNKKKKLKI